MLLNELASAHASNPTIKAAAAAIAPFWQFKGAFVDPQRSKGGQTVVQFRRSSQEGAEKAADEGYNSLDYQKLDDQMQNALHNANVEYKQAGFEEIPRNFNSTPIIAYTIVF